MKELLKQLQAASSWVSVYYNDCVSDRFDFGRILCVGDDFFAMLALSPDAKYDGITVLPIEDVFRVETMTQYEAKMEKLYAGQTWQPWLPKLDESDLVRSVLQEAKQAGKQVNIELRGERDIQLFGSVDAVYDCYFALNQLDSYGRPDGKCFALLSDISVISCDSEESRRLQVLASC